jgi:tetratricopeptide (TPR) repeat protein
MKRLLIVTLLFLSVNVAFSQKYDKKIAASDKSIADAKKGINPKTWISRGELFYEIANVPVAGLGQQMSQETYELVMLGQEAKGSKETLGGKKYIVHTFSDKKVYLDTVLKVVAFWDIPAYEAPEPLKKAYEAFVKAKSLDTGGKNAKKLTENLKLLTEITRVEAYNSYYLRQFAESIECFELTINCSAEMGLIDSMSIYHAGVISVEGKDYASAEKYLRKAVEIGYIEGGEAFANLAETLKVLGKQDEARDVLEKGMVHNPENQRIVIALINSYTSAGKDPKDIIPLIRKAQEIEKDNIGLYLVEGDLYEKMNDLENAIKSYNTALELDPTDFMGPYKLGILYFNRGAKYSEQADAEKEAKEYDRLSELANAELKRALPFLEKAFELNAKEVSTIQALKEINFRFRNENETYNTNAEKYKKILDALEKPAEK